MYLCIKMLPTIKYQSHSFSVWFWLGQTIILLPIPTIGNYFYGTRGTDVSTSAMVCSFTGQVLFQNFHHIYLSLVFHNAIILKPRHWGKTLSTNNLHLEIDDEDPLLSISRPRLPSAPRGYSTDRRRRYAIFFVWNCPFSLSLSLFLLFTFSLCSFFPTGDYYFNGAFWENNFSLNNGVLILLLNMVA